MSLEAGGPPLRQVGRRPHRRGASQGAPGLGLPDEQIPALPLLKPPHNWLPVIKSAIPGYHQYFFERISAEIFGGAGDGRGTARVS